ncbi:MAG: N-acetylmuramoyl-L-alanine amidase [Actinomycetales bacterium]|nr:N-acetylmuramoyl-L-alanine amidase [Actinomycetales bacterium]
MDRFGTVYEGRRGSLSELVVGAQAGGYNTSTIGVSAIGHFHPEKKDSNNTKALKTPPEAMVQSIVDVLAWQAHKWNLDPGGTVRLLTGGSTGSGTRWKPGEWTDPLPVIRGHRDTNITACPGTNLHDLLPDIRTRVITAVDAAHALYGYPATALPAPTLVPLTASQAPIRVSATSVYKWKAVEGAVKYQVVARRAPHRKVMAPVSPDWKVKKTTTDLRYTLTMGEGSTWTVGVRAINAEGAAGPVSVFPTTTRPLPTKRLVRAKAPGASSKAKWKKERDGSYYRNFAYTSSTKGARIKVSKARDVRSIWIIGPSGPGYGRVSVHVGSKLIARVSLAQSRFAPTRRVRVNLPKAASGTVKITTLDQGKPVKISGLVLAR